MPELPEVETVCRGLRPYLEKKTLKRVTLHRSNLRIPFPPLFQERIENTKVQCIERRAKYILIHLDNNLTWVIHLGMSGRIRINNATLQKHDHVLWQTTDNTFFNYNDPRRFGLMDLVLTEEISHHRLFSNLGLEPFDTQLTAEFLLALFKDKMQTIKTLLLNQSFVVGLGNIYVCEALWMSQVSPFRNAETLTLIECGSLLKNIRIVLTKAIEAGGSTLKDYAKPDGELGYFQHQFNVSGREHQRCLTPLCEDTFCQGTIARTVQSGRSTFYCPKCAR